MTLHVKSNAEKANRKHSKRKHVLKVVHVLLLERNTKLE